MGGRNLRRGLLAAAGIPALALLGACATDVQTTAALPSIYLPLASQTAHVDTDAARIAHLVELAVDFSVQHLKPEGALVVKLFHGGAYSPLVKLFKESFKVVKPFKPKASRSNSSETFLIGMGLKKSLVSTA